MNIGTFYDLAHKTMHFDLKHFSDVPLTGKMAALHSCLPTLSMILVMKITHVFRGEDHLTNTAVQVTCIDAFNVGLPYFGICLL